MMATDSPVLHSVRGFILNALAAREWDGKTDAELSETGASVAARLVELSMEGLRIYQEVLKEVCGDASATRIKDLGKKLVIATCRKCLEILGQKD